MFTKLAALFAFAIALNCSSAPLTNPIVLVHGIQLTPKPNDIDAYDTWQKYYDDLKLRYAPGGVWRAETPGGTFGGAHCVDFCPADDATSAQKDVFIVSFTSGSSLNFYQQAGELAAILAQINLHRSQASMTKAQFSLVTHSMGGLAARFYLQNLHTGAAPYAADVGKLITVGTPHKGSWLARLCTAEGESAVISALQPWIPVLYLPAEKAKVQKIYTDFCATNPAIVYLRPEDDSFNTMHRCIATGTANCGLSAGLPSIISSPAVRNAGHLLPSAVSLSELVVGMQRKYCHAVNYELDIAKANSSPATVPQNNCDPYTSDSDEIVSTYSQRFLPPVLNGVTAISPSVALPAIANSVPITLDDRGRIDRIGHLMEAGAPEVRAKINRLLGIPLHAVDSRLPTQSLPNALQLNASFACDISGGGCVAGSTAPTYFRYGLSVGQQGSSTKSAQQIHEAVSLDQVTPTQTATIGVVEPQARDKDDASSPKSSTVLGTGEQEFSDTVSFLPTGATIFYKACVEIGGTESCGSVQSYKLPATGAAASQTLSAPNQVAPVSGSTSTQLLPPFSWGAVSNASSYRLVIAEQTTTISSLQATDGECFSCAANITLESTSTVVPAPGIVAGKTYYWRVKARNPEQYGNWSPVSSFTISASTALSAPVLQLPADSDVTSTSTPDFSWSSVATATSYRFLIATSPSALAIAPSPANSRSVPPPACSRAS